MSNPITDLKHELLAAAERQLTFVAAEADQGRAGLRARRSHVLLIAAAMSIAAVVTLAISAPWRSSPGFLERAEAALIPPAGSILHYRWEHQIPTDAGCESGVNEIWIDQAPPHGFRAFLIDCEGRRRELGGVLSTTKGILEFVPPNSLVVPHIFIGVPPDPAAELRTSIREGSAHHVGTTQLGGRTVERIRVDCTQGPCEGGPPSYHYVDPETYLPIQVVSPAGFRASWTDERFDLVTRFSAFEYLPRTDANLALTDIRAQHPSATGP
jgi:hypothetical protein